MAEREPFFSVVMPTYNVARMCAAAVLSVLGQSEGDFELFVVDDGSTDETPELLRRLPGDPRLRLLRMERNSGQHACRNLAIRGARGRWVTFLDSDDLYLPGRLAEFRRAAEARPGAGFWFSNAYLRRFGRVMGRLFEPGRAIPQGRVPGWYAVGDKFLPYVTTNVAVRREAFTQHGLFRQDLRILEDTELYARMLAGGLEVGAIPEPLSVRTVHEAQITRDHETTFREAVMALEAGGPQPAERELRRSELVLETAAYFFKEGRPEQAREFLLRELGDRARAETLYRLSFVPAAAVLWLKKLRRKALELRFSAGLAPEEFRSVERTIAPWLERAQAL
ncbi:MAG: glycosyltransferase family A protein [Elusimicrobia bacterium]|nr:glycosyltransferase family A protein [Elusimicrobiota bacterium]